MSWQLPFPILTIPKEDRYITLGLPGCRLLMVSHVDRATEFELSVLVN
jgi:hypothetical protein